MMQQQQPVMTPLTGCSRFAFYLVVIGLLSFNIYNLVVEVHKLQTARADPSTTITLERLDELPRIKLYVSGTTTAPTCTRYTCTVSTITVDSFLIELDPKFVFKPVNDVDYYIGVDFPTFRPNPVPWVSIWVLLETEPDPHRGVINIPSSRMVAPVCGINKLRLSYSVDEFINGTIRYEMSVRLDSAPMTYSAGTVCNPFSLPIIADAMDYNVLWRKHSINYTWKDVLLSASAAFNISLTVLAFLFPITILANKRKDFILTKFLSDCGCVCCTTADEQQHQQLVSNF